MASRADESREEIGIEESSQLDPMGDEDMSLIINKDALDKEGYRPEKVEATVRIDHLKTLRSRDMERISSGWIQGERIRGNDRRRPTL